MRILIINSVPDLASTGRICASVGHSLASFGNDVMIGFGRGKAITEFGKSNGVRIGNRFDVYSHAFITRFFDAQGRGSRKATSNFLKKADEFNPDIIWLNNIHGYYINIELLFRWIKGRKGRIFWTLHDCWPFTGHCSYYDFNECMRWESGCEHCPHRRSYPKSYFSNSEKNFALKKALFTNVKNLTIITPSNWLKKEVSRSFLGRYQCRVINNGIDLDSFYPDKNLKLANTEKIILGVANKWIVEKGILDFLKLSSMIKSNERIILVGQMPKALMLPNKIKSVSRTNSLDELRRVYSSADVFFNPTYQDNYPTVNMEAIACCTPVVSYNVGGSCEMIDPRFAVKKGDLEKAYELIECIFQGQVDYDFSMRDAFSNDRFVKEYLDLFLKNS